MDYLRTTLYFGAGILVGGVVGAVSDNFVALFNFWAIMKRWSAWQTAAGGALVGTAVLAALAVGASYISGLEQMVIMLSGFTAMPNYRGALKVLVLDVATPINTAVDSKL